MFEFLRSDVEIIGIRTGKMSGSLKTKPEVIATVCVEHRVMHLMSVSNMRGFVLDIILLVGTFISDKKLLIERVPFVIS